MGSQRKRSLITRGHRVANADASSDLHLVGRRVMAKPKKTNWIEREFEDWFCSDPSLPNGERILVVGCHKPLRRVVDLIAVDQAGGLVIIEVKNEQSNRRAIGQALEYLSQYHDLSLENLTEDYDDEHERGAFRAAFLNTF